MSLNRVVFVIGITSFFISLGLTSCQGSEEVKPDTANNLRAKSIKVNQDDFISNKSGLEGSWRLYKESINGEIMYNSEHESWSLLDTRVLVLNEDSSYIMNHGDYIDVGQFEIIGSSLKLITDKKPLVYDSFKLKSDNLELSYSYEGSRVEYYKRVSDDVKESLVKKYDIMFKK